MTSIYATRAFWSGVLERAIKTAAQSAIAAIGTTAAIHELDWAMVGSVTALATILSVLTSAANAPFTAGTPAPEPVPEVQAQTRDERHAREAGEHPDPPYLIG